MKRKCTRCECPACRARRADIDARLNAMSDGMYLSFMKRINRMSEEIKKIQNE